MLELPLRKDMKSEERNGEVLTEIYQKLVNKVGKKTTLQTSIVAKLAKWNDMVVIITIIKHGKYTFFSKYCGTFCRN